jgi:hypothetical protein
MFGRLIPRPVGAHITLVKPAIPLSGVMLAIYEAIALDPIPFTIPRSFVPEVWRLCFKGSFTAPGRSPRRWLNSRSARSSSRGSLRHVSIRFRCFWPKWMLTSGHADGSRPQFSTQSWLRRAGFEDSSWRSGAVGHVLRQRHHCTFARRVFLCLAFRRRSPPERKRVCASGDVRMKRLRAYLNVMAGLPANPTSSNRALTRRGLRPLAAAGNS